MLAVILLAEGLTGGGAAVRQLLSAGILATALQLVGWLGAALLIILLLQGDTLLDCIIDSRGVHVQQYLLNPTPIRLMARLRSPALMQNIDPDAQEPMVLIGQKEIAWRDVARIQLWPEKLLILVYAPRWWMRLAFIREKIGRKKGVILPYELTAQGGLQFAVPNEEQQDAALPYEEDAPAAEISAEAE